MSNVYKIIDNLEKVLGELTGLKEKVTVEVPKNLDFGDLTSNIALIKAKQAKKDPMEVAKSLASTIEKASDFIGVFAKIEAVKPGFMNFYYSKEFLLSEFNDNMSKYGYGEVDLGKKKKVVIEYSSPNTNKPLHVGHLRNNAIGMSLARLLEFLGFKVIKTEVVNDRGIHIMKSMLAYKLHGQGKTPESENVKSDKFVGDYYVLYSQLEKKDPAIKDKAQEMLVKWEQGDKEIRELWKKMNNWTYQGWKRTYKIFDSEFDEREFESEIFDKGKEVIEDALKNGLVKKRDDGAVVINLEKYGLGDRESGEKVLLRPDGTSVYITQDIYLAKKRFDNHHFDKMIYVVGDEQIYHFKVLFKLLEILGFTWSKKLIHYPYAHVLLPEGKMKSREGKVVDADDLLEEMFELACREIKKRQTAIKESELKDRGWGIALAAVKYWFLKSNAKSHLLFNPKESLDFEGNTGPYILYTFVRLNKILQKAAFEKKNVSYIDNLQESKFEIIRMMVQWPVVLLNFYKNLNPNSIADYLYQLSASLNNYYQSVPVLSSDDDSRKSKLIFVHHSVKLLQTILHLLNFKIIKKM